MPLGQLPIHILEGRDRLDAHPAEQYDDAGAAGRDEAQDEGVLAGAVVALQDGVAEGTLGMELDLVGPGPDEVVDEVGASAEGARGVAQPLAALDALGDGGRIVDAAVPARVRGKAGLVVRVEVVVALVVGQLGGGVGLTVSIAVTVTRYNEFAPSKATRISTMTSRRRSSGVTAGLYADREDGAACLFPELAIGDVNRILDRTASSKP